MKNDHNDWALLVTVLGEFPEQGAALKEIYIFRKPGDLPLVTEVILDRHFQSCDPLQWVAGKAGFREAGIFGKRLPYSMHFEKF